MKREWKPGDVAAARIRLWSGRIIRHANGTWTTDDGDTGWETEKIDEISPLVVIDPEDREQVERLIDTMIGHGWSGLDDEAVPDMQATLRELADPKPRKCGAQITLDYGEHGSSHSCEEPDGHKGHHSDSSLTWTAVQS